MVNAGFDYSDVSNGTVVVPDFAAFEYSGNIATSGLRSNYDQRKENELFDFYVNYDTIVEDWDSEIDVMAGYSWEHRFSEGSNYVTNFDRQGTLDVREDTDYATENYIVSFFGRLNYTFKDKYLLTATLRQMVLHDSLKTIAGDFSHRQLLPGRSTKKASWMILMG